VCVRIHLLIVPPLVSVVRVGSMAFGGKSPLQCCTCPSDVRGPHPILATPAEAVQGQELVRSRPLASVRAPASQRPLHFAESFVERSRALTRAALAFEPARRRVSALPPDRPRLPRR